MSETTSGEGYVDAVDDEGTADAGADTSAAGYVDPAEQADADAAVLGTGQGYANVVDDTGEPGAGEDVSGQGYVEGT